MRKTKICAQEKLNTVESVLHGKESIRAAAKRLYLWDFLLSQDGLLAIKGMESRHLHIQRTSTIPENARFRR